MTNFIWTIKNLYTVQLPDPDYVVTAMWVLTGVDDSVPPVTASIEGSSQLAIDADKPNYIPYDELTETVVVEWVQNFLGPIGVSNCEACVQGQINSIITPPVSPENTPLPWLTPAPTV